jgi:hypothetical protein
VRTVETKGQFARRKNRTPSAVSNWISLGKISPAALVGKGNAARIWVEQAEADLTASLDPSQQFANPHPANMRTTFLPLSTAQPAAIDVERPAAKVPSATSGTGAASELEYDLARRRKADADRAEHEAEGARRKLLVDEGRYVVAEDAAREWTRVLTKLISDIETFLSTTLARHLAEKHGLDWKALTVEIREKFRLFRGGISADARTRRETIEAEGAASLNSTTDRVGSP